MLVNRKKHTSHHYGQQKLGSLCHLNENRQKHADNKEIKKRPLTNSKSV